MTQRGVRRLISRGALAALAIGLALTLGASSNHASSATRLRAADGGARFYEDHFTGLRDPRAFFPLAVWFESVRSARDIEADKGAGINTYVELTADSDLALVRRHGMHALVSQRRRVGSETVGWILGDEVDMWADAGWARWTGRGAADPPVCDPARRGCGYTVMTRQRRSLPDDGRLRYANYGKGVLFWHDFDEAATFVNRFQDIVSADAYWFTDENICSRWEGGTLLAGGERSLRDRECHRASNYGAVVRKLRRLVRPRGSIPVWAFVEVGHPYTEDEWPQIRPRQVRAAVWHSIIGGARGVIYFNHSFGGPHPTQHALREPAYRDVRRIVQRTNRQITALARVLNAPFARHAVQSDGKVAVMTKLHRGAYYIFAGSRSQRAQRVQFDVRCDAVRSVDVIGENRSITPRGRSFRDNFRDSNAVHIYRVTVPATCVR